MTFRTRLEHLATFRSLIILAILFVFFTFILFPILIGQLTALSGGVSLIDMEYSYTPDKVYQMLSAYGPAGRPLYAISTLTADLLYPAVYSLFLSLAILITYKKVFPARSPLQGMIYLPFLTAAADYLENTCVVLLLGSFPQRLDGLAQAASVFTSLKWGLLLVSFVLALVGLAGWGIKTLPAKIKK